VSVRFENALGALVGADGVSITIALGTNPAGGALAGTLTETTVAGVATFSGLSLNQPGVGYTLAANATGLTPATSNAFDVLGLRLAFAQQPTDAFEDAVIAPAVTVRIEDTNGNLQNLDGELIALAIGTNPAGGTLSGTATRTTTAGVATFDNLSIDQAGTGYTVAAKHGIAEAVTSSAFNILLVPIGSATLTASPASVLADGTTASTLTITLLSGSGELLPNIAASRLNLTASHPRGGR